MKSGPERELVERYRVRIETMGRGLGITGLDLVELPESRARREDDRRTEEAALVAFDERGTSTTSDALAERIARWRDEGRAALTCIIGGPDGLQSRVRDRADLVVSFGSFTLPHQIVRALVAEQLYRALTIIGGHPYHRAGDDS